MLPQESLTRQRLLPEYDPPPFHYSGAMVFRDCAYSLAFLLYIPILLYQSLILKKKRGGWRERFGHVPRRNKGGRCVWIHAVSLGEVNATRSLVDQIQKRLPSFEIVISSSTETGYTAAKSHYPDRTVIRYPLDFSWVVRRVLNHIRPSAIILMELEVWPTLLELAESARIPVGIANGRITHEKSMQRFRYPIVRGIAARMFSRLSWVAAQDETYAARFAELGVPRERLHVVGNLKYDTADISQTVAGADELASAMGIASSDRLLVAGSTGPGEEEILLHAFAELSRRIPHLKLAIIPRKPERFDVVASLIENKGYACLRRSRTTGAATDRMNKPTVLLGDTMGELRKFYSLAEVVFVGRSLVPMGGSDLMEVAGLARPMCFGPHVENFSDAAARLQRADGAIQIQNASELVPALEKLLTDPQSSEALGRRARQVVLDQQGATQRNVDLLIRNLDEAV